MSSTLKNQKDSITFFLNHVPLKLSSKLLNKSLNKKKKKCPPDKILNPETNRCVSKTGKIGKDILKKQASRRRSSKSKKR
jgi:hypothetical protein